VARLPKVQYLRLEAPHRAPTPEEARRWRQQSATLYLLQSLERERLSTMPRPASSADLATACARYLACQDLIAKVMHIIENIEASEDDQ